MKISLVTPICVRFSKRLYKSLWNKKNFEIVNARFLKLHSITSYIELSSKCMVVGVNFALLSGNTSGDPHFLFFFLKGYIKVYGIKTNFLRLLMPDF